MKLPEAERPPISIISTKLRHCVPDALARFFVVDLQNDCGCDVEIYDEIDGAVFYTSPTGIQEAPYFGKIHVPMNPNFKEQDVWDLLEVASGMALNDIANETFNYDCMLHGPGTIKSWDEATVKLRAPFLSEGQALLLPDAEWFGVITINLYGMGAFCVASAMVKTA
jgi:hypothetical protein